jgi:hypothetical protein
MQELLGVWRSGKRQAKLARDEKCGHADDSAGVHGAFGLGEEQAQGFARPPHPGLGQLPTLGPLSAVRALKKEGARIPAHLEIVPPKEAAPDEFPHVHVRPLYIYTRVAARTFARCINGSRIASISDVKIRIIRRPIGAVDGVSLRDYDMGRRYDLPSSLAAYLMAQGFAFLEMRQSARSTRWRQTDRRKDAGKPAGVRGASAWAF